MSSLLGKQSSAPGTTSKRRLLDESGSAVSISERLQIAAGRLIYAPHCGFFYGSLLAASITEIVWISHPWINPRHCCKVYFPKSKAFFLVEAYLTLGLIAETTVTLLWQRSAFWRSGANWFDAIVCAMSIFSFGLYWYGGEARLDELVLLVMVAWLALRIARLTAILQKIRERRRRGLEELDVAFPDGGLDDDDDEEENWGECDDVGRIACASSSRAALPIATPIATSPAVGGGTPQTPAQAGGGRCGGGSPPRGSGGSPPRGSVGGDEGGLASPIFGGVELSFLGSSPCNSPLARADPAHGAHTLPCLSLPSAPLAVK